MSQDIILRAPGSDTQLNVNGRIYDLADPPLYDKNEQALDPLVRAQREEILLQIDLKELNEHLFMVVELLNVAYHGVAGVLYKENGIEKALQGDIYAIMSEMGTVCNQSIATMKTFEVGTKEIIGLLKDVYKYLVGGKDKLAVTRLKRCEHMSALMAQESSILSGKFKDLQVKSTKARSDTMTAEAVEHRRKEAAEQAIVDLMTKLKSEEINQSELIKNVGEMQALYDKAQKEEDKESKRAFILTIISSITSVVGAGIGAFTASKNPVDNTVPEAKNKEEAGKIEAARKEAEAKKEKSDAANKALLELQNSLTKLTKQIEDKESEQLQLGAEKKLLQDVAEGKRSEQQKETLKKLEEQITANAKQLDEWGKTLKEAKTKKEAQEKISKDLSGEWAAASASLQQLSAASSSAAARYASKEEAIHAEKMEYLKRKLQLEDEKRKSLVAMTEFAENIKNAKVEKGNAEVSVQALHTAIEALGKIVSILINANLFWQQMVAFCMRLNDTGFVTLLSDITDPAAGLSQEERVAEYHDVNFMMSFLTYMCQWIALNGISSDYAVSAIDAQKQCSKYCKNESSIDEARKLAPGLAKRLSMMLNQKISASIKVSSELMQETDRMRVTYN